MNDKTEATVSPPKRSWVLPIVVLALGAVVTGEGLSLPLSQQYVGIGAGFAVCVVGGTLLLLGAVLARKVWRGEIFEAEEAEGTDISAAPSTARLLWAACGVASPVVTVPVLGFPVAAGIAYACVTRAFGSKSALKDVAIGVVLSGVTWAGFTKLGVDLGPFLPF